MIGVSKREKYDFVNLSVAILRVLKRSVFYRVFSQVCGQNYHNMLSCLKIELVFYDPT